MLYHISLRTTGGTLSSNSDKVCAKNWWWTYAFTRGGTEYSLMRWSQKYLPHVHSKLYLVASKMGTWRFPSAKMWLFVLLKNCVSWKTCHVCPQNYEWEASPLNSAFAFYTTRISAAEETWPNSSSAPSEGHMDGWPMSREMLRLLANGNSARRSRMSSSNHAMQTGRLRPKSGFLYCKVPVSRSWRSSQKNAMWCGKCLLGRCSW